MTSLSQTARQYLDQAKDALGLRYRDLSGRLDQLDQLDASLNGTAERIRGDERLAPEAKRDDLQAATSVYRDATKKLTTEAQQLVEEREKVLRAHLQPPGLEGPDAQGRLANARADALLVLDRTNDNDLAQALETLATQPDDVGHLLLAGWAERYLQARKSNAAAAQWNSQRDAIAAERLGPDAQAARRHLEGLKPARAVPTLMEAHAYNTAASVEGTG